MRTVTAQWLLHKIREAVGGGNAIGPAGKRKLNPFGANFAAGEAFLAGGGGFAEAMALAVKAKPSAAFTVGALRERRAEARKAGARDAKADKMRRMPGEARACGA